MAASLVGVTLLLVSAILVGAITPSEAQEADEEVVVLRTWRPANLPPFTQISEVRLAIAADHRLVYAVTGSLLAYDLDTLAPVASPLATGRPDAFVVDPESGRLLGVFADNAGNSSVAAFQLVNGRLQEVGRIGLTGSLRPGQRVLNVALSPDAKSLFLLSIADTLYLGTGLPSPAAVAGSTFVTRVDVDGIARGRGGFEWTEAVPSCVSPVSTTAPPAIGYVTEGDALFFGCTVTHTQFQKPPAPTGVGRLSLGGGVRTFTLFPRSADYALVGDSAWDRGSSRMLLVHQASGSGKTIHAFDADVLRHIGAIGAGNDAQFQSGMDGRTGRYYQFYPGGLLSVDVRATPLPQGRNYPHLSKVNGNPPAQRRPFAVDERTSTLFVQFETVDHFVLIADRAPHYVPPERPDPDVNTVDVDEAPGTTGINFSGSAQAYGSWTRVVGGTDSLVYNTTPVNVDAQRPPGSGNREIAGGWLETLALGNDEARADATGARRDDRTSSETATGESWPFPPATCADLSRDRTADEAPGATVRCEAGRSAVAMSQSGSFDIGNPHLAHVGSSSTRSNVAVSARTGMVSEVTAVAGGIDVLSGLLKVGSVTVTSTARARGRPDTATSTFERSVRDVTLAGQRLCTDDCEPMAVADAVNARLPGFLSIHFPTPDPTLLGSEGGYQAVIRSRLEDQLEAETVNEHRRDRVEVPGMVVTLYLYDNTRPNRIVMQFAGTEAEARYGIYRVDGTIPDFPGGGGGGGGGDLQEALGAFLGTAGDGSSDRPALIDPASVDSGRTVPKPLRGAWALIRNGLRHTVPLLVVWAILLAPVYLSARRRLLLERDTLQVRAAR